MTDDREAALSRTLARRFTVGVPDYQRMSHHALLAEVRRIHDNGELPMWELVLELTSRLSLCGEELPAIERARTAQVLIGNYTAALNDLAVQRQAAISELVESGEMDQTRIAEALGLTRSRVSQILSD